MLLYNFLYLIGRHFHVYLLCNAFDNCNAANVQNNLSIDNNHGALFTNNTAFKYFNAA